MLFVLYFHINKITKEVFYVGIGNEERPYHNKGRSKHWHNTVNKYGHEVQIIKEFDDWDKACIAETFWIKTFGRKDKKEGLLVNQTDGGDGIRKGHIHSEEARLNITKGNQGKNKGRKHTDATREIYRKSNSGRITSNATKQKLSLTGKLAWIKRKNKTQN